MRAAKRIPNPPGILRGKALLRLFLLLAAAAAVAAVASRFGVSHDYAYLRAVLMTGAQGGYYYTLGTRLAARAHQAHGVCSRLCRRPARSRTWRGWSNPIAAVLPPSPWFRTAYRCRQTPGSKCWAGSPSPS